MNDIEEKNTSKKTLPIILMAVTGGFAGFVFGLLHLLDIFAQISESSAVIGVQTTTIAAMSLVLVEPLAIFYLLATQEIVRMPSRNVNIAIVSIVVALLATLHFNIPNLLGEFVFHPKEYRECEEMRRCTGTKSSRCTDYWTLNGHCEK